jgi:hypothetical protein
VVLFLVVLLLAVLVFIIPLRFAFVLVVEFLLGSVFFVFSSLFLVLYVAEEVVLTLSCSRVVFVLWPLTSLPVRFVAATFCCFFSVLWDECVENW